MNALKVSSLIIGTLSVTVFVPKYFHLQDQLQTMPLWAGLAVVMLDTVVMFAGMLWGAAIAFRAWPDPVVVIRKD